MGHNAALSCIRIKYGDHCVKLLSQVGFELTTLGRVESSVATV